MLLTGVPASKETSNRQLPERKEEEGHRKEGWDDDEWEVRLIREGEYITILITVCYRYLHPFWTAMSTSPFLASVNRTKPTSTGVTSFHVTWE